MRICPDCDKKFDEEYTRCPDDGAVLLSLDGNQESFVQERAELQRLQMVEAPHGKYTIIAKIGQGGWGGVYKAFQHSTKRVVALKVLRADVAEDPSARRRFHQEAEAVSKLQHPNTVTMFDFGETPADVLFMAMEYVEGESLDALIAADGPLSPLRTVRICRQVALSLAEAHQHGIIHRDIKPLNIMLTEVGGQKEFVKVLDFGVAKLISSDITLTSTGSTFGTPEYMSPEQVQSRDIDHRSDLYSLGIILYEMLSGGPPFTGKSAVTVALAHARKKPPPLEIDFEMPRSLSILLKRLLSKDASARPENAMNLADELKEIESELLLSSPRARLPALAARELGRMISSNWASIITTMAVVLIMVAGLLVLKEKVLQPGESSEQSAAAAEVRSSPPEEVLAPVERDTRSPVPADLLIQGEAVVEPEVAAAAAEREDAIADVDFPLPPALPEVRSEVSPEVIPEVSPEVSPEPEDTKATTPSREEVTAELPAEVATGEPDAAPEKRTVRVTLTSNQEGAEVFLGGRSLCSTPCSRRAKAGEVRSYTVKKKGFRPLTKKVHFGRDETVLFKLKKSSPSEEDGLKGGEASSGKDGLK